jgi:hypothetical protein
MIRGFKAGLNKTKGWFQRVFTPSNKKPEDMDAASRAGSAILLMTDAVEFHKAGISLNSLSGDAFGPGSFLLCHSVELAMKAYLMATGSTLDDVVGHDLKRLRNRCRERGLTLSHPRAKLVLDMIGPVHKKHLLRYKRPGSVIMPNNIEFEDFVSSVVADIWPTIHIAERRDLQ